MASNSYKYVSHSPRLHEVELAVAPPSSPELAKTDLLWMLRTLELRAECAELQVQGSSRSKDWIHDVHTEEELIEFVRNRILNVAKGLPKRYLKPPLGQSGLEINLERYLLSEGGDANSGTTETESELMTKWKTTVENTTKLSVLSTTMSILGWCILDNKPTEGRCVNCTDNDVVKMQDKLLRCDVCWNWFHKSCVGNLPPTIEDEKFCCLKCINKVTSCQLCIICNEVQIKNFELCCENCVNTMYQPIV